MGTNSQLFFMLNNSYRLSFLICRLSGLQLRQRHTDGIELSTAQVGDEEKAANNKKKHLL